MGLFQNRQRFMSLFLGTAVAIAFAVQFIPFLTPLIIASIFAFGIERRVSRFTHNSSSRRWSTLAFISIFIFAIAGPVTFVLYRIANKLTELSRGGVQNTQLFHSLEHLKNRMLEFVSTLNPEIVSHFPMGDGSYMNRLSTAIVTGSTSFASALPDVLISFLVFLAALYFLVMQSKNIKAKLIQLEILNRPKLERLIQMTQRICYNTLVSSVVIGFIQATIITIGSLIFGYREPTLIFVVTFFVSFIPIIGAGPVAGLLAVNSFIIGETGAAIGLMVFSFLGGSIDNLIKPYILSHSEEEAIHPVISVLTFVGAVIVYGFPGLLLGPVLLQLAYQLVPLLFSKEETTEITSN